MCFFALFTGHGSFQANCRLPLCPLGRKLRSSRSKCGFGCFVCMQPMLPTHFPGCLHPSHRRSEAICPAIKSAAFQHHRFTFLSTLGLCPVISKNCYPAAFTRRARNHRIIQVGVRDHVRQGFASGTGSFTESLRSLYCELMVVTRLSF